MQSSSASSNSSNSGPQPVTTGAESDVNKPSSTSPATTSQEGSAKTKDHVDKHEASRQRWEDARARAMEKNKDLLEHLQKNESKGACRKMLKRLTQKELRKILDEEFDRPKKKKRKAKSSVNNRLSKKNKLVLQNSIRTCCESAPRIVIDLDYLLENTFSSRKSLYQQIGQAYGYMQKSLWPCPLSLCGIPEASKPEMKKFCQSELWNGVETTAEPIEKAFPKEKMIYLTADTDNVVKEFDPSKVYIIGGILDRNSKKGSTADKAKELGIRAEKLPIDTYRVACGRPGLRKVITVNQVAQIMLDFQMSKSWKYALDMNVPDRTGQGEASSAIAVSQSKSWKYAGNKRPLVALILGGSSGIGFSFATIFRKAGWTIVLVARDPSKLEAAAKVLRDTAVEKQTNDSEFEPLVLVAPCDCSSMGEIRRLQNSLEKSSMEIHALIVSAGTFKWDDDKAVTEDGGYLLQQNFFSKLFAAKGLLHLLLGKYGLCLASQNELQLVKKDPGTPLDHKRVFVCVGSEAGKPGFSDRVDNTEKEQKYIESMAKVHDWATALQKQCKDVGLEDVVSMKLLEPPLIDTALARKEFTRLNINFENVPQCGQYVQKFCNDQLNDLL